MIATLIARPDDGPPAVIAPEPWQEVTEVDFSDTGLDPSTFETEEAAMEQRREVWSGHPVAGADGIDPSDEGAAGR